MSNPSQELVELVRRAHGDCSYYRVAQLLNVEPAAVARWRKGRGHMSDGIITAACKLARLEDSLRWRSYIGAERERGPEGDHWREKREDFERMAAGLPPREGGELHLFIKGLPKHAASILLMVLTAVGAGALPSQRASAQDAPSSLARSVYYVKLRRWLLQAVRRSVMSPAF